MSPETGSGSSAETEFMSLAAEVPPGQRGEVLAAMREICAGNSDQSSILPSGVVQLHE